MATSLSEPEMAPFSASAQLWKTHCMTDGQLTPPSSPDDPKESLHRYGSRFNLSKLLKKSKPAKSYVNELSRTLSKPTQIDGPQLHITPISPDVLPPSPVDSDESCQKSPCELRRVPSSYNGLRELALQQSINVPRRPTPLLPSPIIDTKSTTSSSYDDRNAQPQTPNETYRSYEDLHILSCYVEDSPVISYGTEGHLGQSEVPNLEQDSRDSEDGEFAAWDATDLTPTREAQRETTCSTESEWLASATSQDQRRQRYKTRCYQVVEHPPWMRTSNTDEDHENQILLATVLVGPGRPKLVQIQRPPSSRSGSSSRSAARYDHHPQTPPREPLERSAFSPDTPLSVPHDANNISSVLLHTNGRTTWSKLSLIPAPLTIPISSQRMSDSSQSASIFSSTTYRLRCLADPFGSPRNTHIHNHNTSPQTSPNTLTYSIPARQSSFRTQPCPASPIHSSSETPALFARYRKLRQTLDCLTKAIEAFPQDPLTLDSPLITSLRNVRVHAESHLACLSKIFPVVNRGLLSSLAAWILVDLHLFRLTEKRKSSTNADPGLRHIPEKARAMLGIGVQDANVEGDLADEWLAKRIRVVRISVGVVAQRLMASIRGTWDEDLWSSLKVLFDVVETGTEKRSDGWM